MRHHLTCPTTLIASIVLCTATLAGCEEAGPPEDRAIVAELSSSARRHRAETIRDAAARVGFTNGALLAGIGDAETGLAHCWSEATWACQGPWSSSCNGPVIAGSADGPCSIREGGLGMFQFDGGNYDQTLARDGHGILTVEGSVERVVTFVANMVARSVFIPEVADAASAIDWMNSLPIASGDPRYEAWISTVTRYYNGCPVGASCWASRRAGYDRLTRGVYWEMGGPAFWSIALPAPSLPSEPPFEEGRSAARNGDGRLEVFVQDAYGGAAHIWQLSPSGGWGGWRGFGGQIAGRPLLLTNADGRLEVFARGSDGALHHAWQHEPSGGWSDWAGFSGPVAGDAAGTLTPDGRLVVFVRGDDGGIWHRWQEDASWSDWHPLGGHLGGDPAVARNTDGRLEVFARGADGALWHTWQHAPGGGWAGWSSLGGEIDGTPRLARNADGRLEVFARGSDGALWHLWQTAPAQGPWSAWASFGGYVDGDFSVNTNLDGRLEVAARGADGAVHLLWQLAPSSGWSDWAYLGGEITAGPVLGRNADGRLEVFARGTDGGLWHAWQLGGDAGWSDWWSLGGEIEAL